MVPVTGSDAEQMRGMSMVMPDLWQQPVKSLQYWLDHHHTSYSHDLEMAAIHDLEARIRCSEQKGEPHSSGSGSSSASGSSNGLGEAHSRPHRHAPQGPAHQELVGGPGGSSSSSSSLAQPQMGVPGGSGAETHARSRHTT